MAKETPYQFAKAHPELKLRPQAVYQHCLKQAAPHDRDRDGRIVIDVSKFLAWLISREETRAQKAVRKQLKLKPV